MAFCYRKKIQAGKYEVLQIKRYQGFIKENLFMKKDFWFSLFFYQRNR